MKSRGIAYSIAILVVSSGLTGCIGGGSDDREVPDSEYYLLQTPDASFSGLAAEESVSTMPLSNKITVNKVQLPAYLQNQGIVTVSQDRLVTIASYNFWAEPLAEAIPALVEYEVAKNQPGETGKLDLDIKFFHGNLSGLVILDLNWSFHANCEDSHSARFAHSIQQESAGYSALVDAHAKLLKQLSTAISRDLQEMTFCE